MNNSKKKSDEHGVESDRQCRRITMNTHLECGGNYQKE